MHNFCVFLEKEWLEIVRTKKFFILLCIFALFGMMGPMTAKYMQEIIAVSMGGEVGIAIPAGTWEDSWSQFYSNVFQMGSLCSVFIFMGTVTNEKLSGAAALTLTKNLSHGKFVLAKFVSALSVYFVAFVSALGICSVYTFLLFGYTGKVVHVVMGGLMCVLVMTVLISFVILASTLSRSIAMSALLSFCGYILIIISSYIPVIGKVMPGSLLSNVVNYTVGITHGSLLRSSAVALSICLVCIYASVMILKKKEL